ncbi:hypothetical protein [Segniliparus sp.]|uniref:hypothetical protein n=1 Tax=Segniliparus sp. TaxID=2804064 RepID=UPI003F66BD31
MGGLGIADRIEPLEIDPNGFDTIASPDIALLTPLTPCGWDAYRATLVEAFPRESRAGDRYVQLTRAGDRSSLDDHGQFRTLSRAGQAAPLFYAPLAAVLFGCWFSARAILALPAQRGAYAEAPVVVSDAGVKRTHAELVGAEHLSAYTRARTSCFKTGSPFPNTHFGVNADLRETLNHELLRHPERGARRAPEPPPVRGGRQRGWRGKRDRQERGRRFATEADRMA